MARFGRITAACVLALGLSGCLAGTTEATQMVSGGGLDVLLLGFWHGMIAPVSLVLSILSDYYPSLLGMGLKVYQGGEAGFVYNIGFCFGVFFWPAFIIWRPRF